jgi:hypothetical protein
MTQKAKRHKSILPTSFHLTNLLPSPSSTSQSNIDILSRLPSTNVLLKEITLISTLHFNAALIILHHSHVTHSLGQNKSHRAHHLQPYSTLSDASRLSTPNTSKNYSASTCTCTQSEQNYSMRTQLINSAFLNISNQFAGSRSTPSSTSQSNIDILSRLPSTNVLLKEITLISTLQFPAALIMLHHSHITHSLAQNKSHRAHHLQLYSTLTDASRLSTPNTSKNYFASTCTCTQSEQNYSMRTQLINSALFNISNQFAGSRSTKKKKTQSLRKMLSKTYISDSSQKKITDSFTTLTSSFVRGRIT